MIWILNVAYLFLYNVLFQFPVDQNDLISPHRETCAVLYIHVRDYRLFLENDRALTFAEDVHGTVELVPRWTFP